MSTKNIVITGKIGDRIKSFRIEKKLTLVQLSDLIGISHGSLSGLENNKSKPSAETLSSFCLYTDIDIKWLLTGEKTKKSQEKAERAEETRKFDILNEVEKWLGEEVKKDPKNEIWFQIQFEKKFPDFKTWKEEGDETERHRSVYPTSKVA
ncbi:MAG: helix-turn-helix transcriptional regulator [Desulfobulbus sp.]|nr:helix-turn-helix transcriptional regulator [Desulfobulbus sp.]